jgi:hypothetical protein
VLGRVAGSQREARLIAASAIGRIAA